MRRLAVESEVSGKDAVLDLRINTRDAQLVALARHINVGGLTSADAGEIIFVDVGGDLEARGRNNFRKTFAVAADFADLEIERGYAAGYRRTDDKIIHFAARDFQTFLQALQF